MQKKQHKTLISMKVKDLRQKNFLDNRVSDVQEIQPVIAAREAECVRGCLRRKGKVKVSVK